MLYAWIDGVRRPPLEKGERTICRDCGGLLTSVIPAENVRHWRHKGGDCDPWSEPETPWHLGWKERFDISCREIGFQDPVTGERHRADVYCPGNPKGTVLELQHSSISEDERIAREFFYQQTHRMFWLVHIHNETTFAGYSFGFSLDFKSRPVSLEHRSFWIMRRMGRSNQFIEKWKRATAHVFLNWNNHIFYLASEGVSRRLTGGPALKKGEFAICLLEQEDFIRAVVGVDQNQAAL